MIIQLKDMNQIKKIIDITKYEIEVYPKQSQKGYYMKWHIDDCFILNNSTPPAIGNYIKLSQKKYAVYTRKPEYSCVVFLSDYDVDFKGGILEFFDGIQIKPKKGLIVFFKNDIMHRVTRIESGTRNSILIKFYQINDSRLTGL